MSRGEAERLIESGSVTVAGKVVTTPGLLVQPSDMRSSIKVQGKLLYDLGQQQQPQKVRIWIVHKRVGEVVSEHDPEGRPSFLERVSGLGKRKQHLKAVGRLDINSEGLILVTNDGAYKRELELPTNRLHRTYRVRVHGKLSAYKLRVMRQGVTLDKMHYKGMEVHIESSKAAAATNMWLRLTCIEGKNRQIRKVMTYLGCKFVFVLFCGKRNYDILTSLRHSIRNPIDSYFLWRLRTGIDSSWHGTGGSCHTIGKTQASREVGH